MDWLTGPIPEGYRFFYQKHMAHHLLPSMDREWLGALTHIFLIRDPRDMIPSLARVLPHPALLDTGLPQQCEIFQLVCNHKGSIPPVIDAQDLQNNPEPLLSQLCERLNVPFDRAMLSWLPGPRDTDGVWAKHWYAMTERSNRFQPYQSKKKALPETLQMLLKSCLEYYEQLYSHRLSNAL